MKICILTERFYPQVVGSGTSAYLLAKGLLTKGHHVTVITDASIRKLKGASELPFDMVYVDQLEKFNTGQSSFKVPIEQIAGL